MLEYVLYLLKQIHFGGHAVLASSEHVLSRTPFDPISPVTRDTENRSKCYNIFTLVSRFKLKFAVLPMSLRGYLQCISTMDMVEDQINSFPQYLALTSDPDCGWLVPFLYK
jgi:hypothetical protein